MSSWDEFEQSWPDPVLRDEALARLRERVKRQPWPRDTQLTPTEKRCLQAASFGMKAADTAELFGSLSEYSVKQHLKAARRRLRAKNTTHACCEALRNGLIT